MGEDEDPHPDEQGKLLQERVAHPAWQISPPRTQETPGQPKGEPRGPAGFPTGLVCCNEAVEAGGQGQAPEAPDLESTARLWLQNVSIPGPLSGPDFISGRSGVDWEGGRGWFPREVENFPWAHRNTVTALRSPQVYSAGQSGGCAWGFGETGKIQKDQTGQISLSSEGKPKAPTRPLPAL